MIWYGMLMAAVAAERVGELVVARRNERWSHARGAIEAGQGHYPAMVALHTALLLGCPVEVWLADRPFLPVLAWPMAAVLAGAQALRWWCIATLGSRWNTRVIVVPGLPLVARGPYRALRHPNYVAVVAEGVALPLVHTAWVTAALFTLADAAVLTVRVRCENRLLADVTASLASAPA
ncbi:isoprenylcysteine carboxyl methyltransferase family protein [Streptomyces sp. NPDC002742]|uniref:isoprenylcysteine carboxyl methyltransferase family protein n=1 Tax=Streptomyces sp. NPDC002742 TaxID=3364663 RepID=UPI0036B639BF